MVNPPSAVETSRIAIVGDGVGALITLAVLVHAGMASHEITIYGDSPHPLSHLHRYAVVLGQDRMRSESNGHLAPVDFPGMAWTDTCRLRSPWPLVASLCDRYNPPLELLVAQADLLTSRFDFHQRKAPFRIGQILRAQTPEPLFLLLDIEGNLVGAARHVILALGHAGLAWPQAVLPWQSHPGIVHAYDGPSFQAGERVAVIGSGMTAAHIWSLGLEKGAQITALHRRPLRYQRLNASRSAFSAVGIDAYRRFSPAERLAMLGELGHGTIPWRFSWQRHWRKARRRGQLRSIQGELATIEPAGHEVDGPLVLHLQTGESVEVDGLVCATGFVTAAHAYPLIAQLALAYDLPTVGNFLAVADDFTLPPLSQDINVLGVVGSLARWALPVADTFVGIKYAARRLAHQLLS